jgi:methyl-accepting chemotaxis protein
MTTAKTITAAEQSAADESTRQLQELAEALRRVATGDLKVRLPRRAGLSGEVADAFNDVVALQERQHLGVRRISRIVGRDGRLTERLDEEGYDGAWAESQRAITR